MTTLSCSFRKLNSKFQFMFSRGLWGLGHKLKCFLKHDFGQERLMRLFMTAIQVLLQTWVYVLISLAVHASKPFKAPSLKKVPKLKQLYHLIHSIYLKYLWDWLCQQIARCVFLLSTSFIKGENQGRFPSCHFYPYHSIAISSTYRVCIVSLSCFHKTGKGR